MDVYLVENCLFQLNRKNMAAFLCINNAKVDANRKQLSLGLLVLFSLSMVSVPWLEQWHAEGP